MQIEKIKLGIVGVGKIVRDQHLPAISKSDAYELVATASRNASIEGVASFVDIESMLDATPNLEAVALCMPPQYRYDAARFALERGLHVLLEKPPGATVSEVEQLDRLAKAQSVSLYASWHSRHGAAVGALKKILAERTITSARLTWHESVRKWHPGQTWIWQAGGLGVFDPGINGLSILTAVLPESLFVTGASLSFPSNKAAPIAAKVDFRTPSGLLIHSDYDWRTDSGELWDIEFVTDRGAISISDGGHRLSVDGEVQTIEPFSEHGEYEAIYAHFADLITKRRSDVDLRPLKLVADAFLLGERIELEPFIE